MGIRKFISNLFAPDEEKKKKPAGTTSQASAASTGNRAVGKTIVKTTQSSGKSGGNTTKKETAGAKNTNNKNTGTNNKTRTSKAAEAKTDSRRTVAVGKTAVKLPTQEQKETAKSPIAQAWNQRKETVAQQQVAKAQQKKSATAKQPKIIEKFNARQQEKNAQQKAQQQAQKNRKNQMQLLSDAAGSYEARMKAIADRASRAPESITQEDVNAYNDLWTRYQQTLGNYAKAKGEQDAEEQLRKTQKKSAQQQILAAMGAGETMQGTTGQQNNTIFDVDPRQQIINAQIAGQGAQAAAQQRAQQLPKTLAAIGLGGIAAAQDTVGTAMGMGEQAAWALSPGAQQDAAQRADHARQTAAWQQENRDAQKKMEKAFALTEDDALGQFLVELNYNFVQQGISTVAGGIFGKAGGTALSALGKEASAAGGNLAGQIGSRAAQRAAASAQVGGKALQGAARYLQKNAPLATMATLAGANNYQAAIGGGADEGQAMAYAVLTGAAEAVTEKLFGGNPLMDNEAGWVNRALYKMLGDRKFLKALESVPVETFNEGFEEVIANYLYSAAQAATGQQVELPSAEENLHSFALGAAMGGMGQAAKLAGNAMRQRSADIETGELMQRMGAGNELIAAGLALPGSRAEMHATELRLRNQQPTARQLGRQYRENVRAQDLLTAKQMETENTVRRMAENVGAQVAFDATISDAAGHDSAADGYYKDNVLHIARDADKPAMTVAVHEITHHLQQAAPEQYRTFRAYAMRLQGEGAVRAMQERYARGGVELTEEEAMDEIAASTAEKLLTDRGSIESLIRENPSVAQRFFDALREFIRKLTGRVDPQLRQAEKLWTEAYQAAKGSKNAAPEDGKAQYLYKGKDAETGKSIYESNFPKGTPKAAKSEHILYLVQNVWSKKPITMYVEDEVTGLPRMIEAQFDPTYSEERGVETDARKLAGGNNLGNAKERRVTMDLADDYYRIAQEADYDHSSPEEGKLIATHEGVKTWHYFADNILFQENGEKEKTPYRVVVNVKEKADGSYVYSFSAFAEKNKSRAPTSFNTGVTTNLSDGGNARLSNATIAQQEGESKKKFLLKEDSQGRKLTEAQREYFRDSKVVDGEGRLLTLYHGTGAKFTVFDKGRIEQNFQNRGGDLGFYFSPYIEDAQGYAREASFSTGGEKAIMEVYLNLKNPLVVEDEGWGSAISQADIRHGDLKRWAQEGGHDGIIVKSTDEVDDDGTPDAVYIAFSPEQIKSVTNQNPTSDPDIRYSLKEDERKQKQLEVIRKSNPVEDDYHTWIRSTDDIHTFREALNDPEWADYDEFDPDYTKAMAEEALESGEIKVFSSYPIQSGVFVTPSRMEAESYAGRGKIYSKTVKTDDVAWIDPTQGQFAPVVEKKFLLKEASADEGYWDDLSYRRYDESSPMSRAGYAMMADDAYSVETYGEKLVAVRQSELRPISEFQDQIAEAWERDKENGMLPYELKKYHADMSGEEVAAAFDPEDIVMSADAWDNEDMVMWAYEKVFDGVPGVKTRDGAIVFDENLLHRLDTDSDVLGSELHNQPKYALKEDGKDLKTMRAERTDVRREIDKLEWLEEKQGYLDETDAAAMKQLREREKDLTERIDVANAAAKENRGTEAERIMQKAKGEAAAAQPTQAGKTLRQDLLDTFSVQAGKRKELGRAIDRVAARVREQGYATASDGAELFRGLYNAGVVVDTTASEHYAEIRRTLRGVKLHIDETVRAELGDDFTRTRQEAFRNGIILTTKDNEGVGIDVEHKEMAELFPGVFDNYNTDRTAQLEDMIHAAELGRPEHISLMEQAMRAGGEDAVAQQMTFFDRYLTNALENYAKQAGFEMRVKQGEIMKAAKARAIAADAWEKQSQRKAMAEAQNRTLKVFQRLRRMKKDQSAETKALIDEIVGNFDTMAKTLRKDKEATWRDMRKIYDEARKDPNFLPREDWEQKFSRLDAARVGELSREDALDLYKRGVELIHMIRTKDKEIAEENARELDDLYHNSVQEIETSDGDKWKFNRKGEAKKKLSSNRFVRKYWDGEQLSPMNMIEKMGGWRRDGAFYSMAKQLERGEYDKQRYIIQSDALLKEFVEKHEKWIAKADGKGKDAIWYEVEVPAFLEAGNGGADLRENKSVKIYMTPMIKVKLYLDSLNYDNLRHINFGGTKFPDKRIYSAAKTEEDELEAYANGVTVKMQPGFVKSLVADLTPEEKELAFILGTKYFNGYAKEEINRVSNLLEGHDKAMNDNYSPIYTDANFLGKSADPAIVDATIEGMGPLKNRVWSGKPVMAVSALSAFQKHRDMTAKYVGLAIPVRNMNALLNYTEKGYSDSMYAVIGKKWGDEAVQYLKDLMKDIQNKPADEVNVVERIVKWTTNNYVKAVFGFNPGTVIKQAPGFFMAGARLGFDTIPATSMLHSAWGKYRDLIAKYTPIMEWRARGYSTREMSDLKNNPSWTQRNRAFKFVFGGAIQWMDLHTCAAIWPWAENYVKKHYPNLKPGSRSAINSGKDAYYKKVAEVFEDAIANSQPMYDDMHTAKIMHSNNGIARGITMFHTAQLTQANAIRQAHGEMKRAQAENDKEGLKRGQKAFKDSIMALLISTLSFEAVGALVAIAKRKDKALRDDEGEMTPATIAKYMADATAKDLLGNVVGWDTAYDIGTHFLFGDTWYGFEMPGVDAIQDFIDDAPKLAQAGVKFVGGLSGVTDTGDFQYYLRTAGNDFRKSLKTLALDGSYLVGIPAKNMESYILGLMGWINPDLAAAYNNAWGGSYDKSSVGALSGKPKEQAAAIRKAVRNRAKDASDEAVAELQRLYQTAGTEVLPQAVADTITIETGEDSSEKVELSLKQKSDYQKAYDKVVSAELNQLIASPEYAKLSDDQKAGAVVLLYQYAAEQGKQAAVAEYAPKGWKAKAARAAEEGADVYQTVIYKAATEEIEGDTGEDGKTVAGSKNKKLFDALDAMNFTAEQKAAIYKTSVDDFTEDSGYADAKNAGVSDWQYAAFKANTGTIKSDKDEDGKTITGSKKGKVMDYINGLDISNEAKDALYYAAGYTESKIGEAPWHGGTTGSKKSSGKRSKKSGSTKKAQKAAKKQTAARAALATPEMQNYLQKYGVTQANGRPATAADLQSSVERYIRKYTGGRSLPRAGETMNLPSDLPRAGEALTTRDLPRAGEEVQMQSLPTYNDLARQREAQESLEERYYKKFGRR